MNLAGRLADPGLLRAAWLEVERNDAEDGTLGPATLRFGENLPENLDALADALGSGTFEPSDLVEVSVPKQDGTARVLHVPTIRDRIVERAILDLISPWVDPFLGSAAFGFRPGLGVVDAVQAVTALRDEGYAWVVRTDIADCFPTIDPERALRALGALLPEASLLPLIQALTERCARSQKRGRVMVPGLPPQGSPLSPLLCNVVLRTFDDAVLATGHQVDALRRRHGGRRSVEAIG